MADTIKTFSGRLDYQSDDHGIVKILERDSEQILHSYGAFTVAKALGVLDAENPNSVQPEEVQQYRSELVKLSGQIVHGEFNVEKGGLVSLHLDRTATISA